MGSSTCSGGRGRLRSRTPSPPLRRPAAGAVAPASSSSSTRRTASKAAPAAALSTRAGPRVGRGDLGDASIGSSVVRPPRSADPTSPGSTTAPPARGTSRLARQQLLGRRGRVRRAAPCAATVPVGRLAAVAQHVLEQGARGRRDLVQPALRPRRARAASAEHGCSPLTPACGPPAAPRPRRSGRAGRSVASQARARSSSRATAASTRAGSACTMWRRSVRGGLTRDDEGIKDRELEPGELVERAQQRRPGGRSGGQLAGVVRGWSGEIGTLEEQPGQPVVRPATQLVGERAEALGAGGRSGHPATLPVRRPTAAPRGGGADEQRRAAPRRRHRRRPGPRGQRGLLPRRAAGLRRRRRHGRPRRRRRRQRDRGRGVRAGSPTTGYDPAPRRRGRRRDPAAPASTGSRSTARPSARRGAAASTPAPPRSSRCWSRTTTSPTWLLANLGDSRIYRFVDGVLDQVSVDHSVVQELVDAGAITAEDAATHPERHVITRALGGPRRAEADYFLLPLPLCRAAGALLRRRQRDDRRRRDGRRSSPRPPTRATPPTGRRAPRSRPVVATTPRRSSSMWWDWSNESAYDSERQRVSLEQKLGALP